MTPSRPLTAAAIFAGMMQRWKLGAMVAAGTMITAAVLVLVLPPVYEARTSFIIGRSVPGKIASTLASTAGSQAAASTRAISALDASESPGFNMQLIESRVLRKRLLHSLFSNPRSGAPRDSATLLDILRARSSSSARREEIALKKISRATSIGFDRSSNLVAVSVRLQWPELAAAVANRTVELAGALNNELRRSRTRSTSDFLKTRVDTAKSEVQRSEERAQQFYEQNRSWRGSPQLVSTEAQLTRETTESMTLFLALRHQLDVARLNDFSDAALITVVDEAVPPRKALWPRYGVLLANAILVALILGLVVTAVTTIVANKRGVSRAREQDHPVSEVISPDGMRGPRKADVDGSIFSTVVFPLFACGLVIHSLVMAALFGWFGLPEQTVRAIAAWKETALAALCIIVVLRAVLGHGPRAVFSWPDMWVGGLIVLAVLFFLTQNLWLRYNLPDSAGQLGIRDAVYFMLAYFVGRAMPEIVTDERTSKRLFTLVVATCAIGVVERFLVGPEILVGLGVAAYFQDFLGVSAFTAGNDFGLPLNYWTMIGGHLFRRAGSVYLSGQGFAVPFLLFFPLATAWVFLRPARSRRLIAAYLLICAGLVLTLTRMTIVVSVIQLIIFASLRKRPHWAVTALGVAAAVFAAAFTFIPGFPAFVWQTLSWQEGSSVSHVDDWVSGFATLIQHPWGSGLGTTDQTAVRAGLEPLTGDNLFLKYGVELGAAGLALLMLALAAFANQGRLLFSRGATLNEQRVGITLMLASIGIALNGITTVVFNSIALGWLFFWLAGASVTAASRLPETGTATQ